MSLGPIQPSRTADRGIGGIEPSPDRPGTATLTRRALSVGRIKAKLDQSVLKHRPFRPWQALGVVVLRGAYKTACRLGEHQQSGWFGCRGERGFVTRRGQLLPQVELVLSSYGGWLTLCPWLLALPALRRLVLPKSEAAQALAQALRGEPHNVTVVLV